MMKVIFMKLMKTKIARKIGESGLHKVDKDKNYLELFQSKMSSRKNA